MAVVTNDWRGVIIELDHGETTELTKILETIKAGGAATTLTGFLTALGLVAAAVTVVAAALALHAAWELIAIRAMDQGDGVILTMPWFTPGTVIPATRHPTDINQNWATTDDGVFVSPGGDRVKWHVDRHTGDPQSVTFRMSNQCQSGWDKSFILRDGEGNQWEVKARAHAAGENGLWAQQCQNGQQITFRKPAFLGRWIDVFSVGGLAPLQGGDRVNFAWTQD